MRKGSMDSYLTSSQDDKTSVKIEKRKQACEICLPSKKQMVHAHWTGMAQPRAAEQMAVHRIVRFWTSHRDFTSRMLVEELIRDGPTTEKARSISFESLVAMLREKPVIMRTNACLQRLHLRAISLIGNLGNLEPEHLNVRVFLASFMIVCRPTNVFENMGDLETALLTSATRLLQTFESMCKAIRDKDSQAFARLAKGSPESDLSFPKLLYDYMSCFKAWKVPDEAKLTSRIKHALVALYQARQHLPKDEPEDSKLKVEFRTQIERLRSKLQQIAGTEAMIEFDAKHNTTEDGSAAAAGGAPSATGVYAEVPASMSNEQLAHEVLLDPSFQLLDNGGCAEDDAFQRIRESFHVAFWDSLVDDLRLSRPCYVRVLRVLTEIRDDIVEIGGSKEAARIGEVIDVELIKQQVDKGLYGWASCQALVESIMVAIRSVLESKREEETDAKWQQVQAAMACAEASAQPVVFCKALEFLLSCVNMVRIDSANARLRSIAPVIREHGIEYERGKMQAKLKSGEVTLERTGQWVKQTVAQEVAADSALLKRLEEGSEAAFVHVMASGMVELVSGLAAPPTAQTSWCPETLLLDVQRLRALGAELQGQVQSAAMLAAASHAPAALGRRADSRAVEAVAGVLVSHSEGALTEQSVMEAADAAAAAMEAVAKDGWAPHASSTQGVSVAAPIDIRRAVIQSAKVGSPVYEVMVRRVKRLWLEVVRDGRHSEQAAAALSGVTARLLLRVVKAAGKLRRVAEVNRHVHLEHYNGFIREGAADAALSMKSGTNSLDSI